MYLGEKCDLCQPIWALKVMDFLFFPIPMVYSQKVKELLLFFETVIYSFIIIEDHQNIYVLMLIRL